MSSYEDGRLPHDAADALILNLELVYREIPAQEQVDGNPLNGAIVGRALEYLRTLQDEHTGIQEMRTPPRMQSSSVGRPRFDIPRRQLQFLIESGFTGPKSAAIIGVSLTTVRRRMSEYVYTSEYATISDDVLKQLIIREFPTCWNKQIVSRGYRVQQVRVREAMSQKGVL